MERSAANTLRIVGMVVTVVLVVAGCGALLFIAWFVVLRGGLGRNAMITHPRAANSFFGALLAAVGLVTLGIVTIRRLAAGIVGVQTSSRRLATAAATASGVPAPSPARARLYSSTLGKKTIGWLALALGGKIAVGAIQLFQLTLRPFVPRGWTLMLLGPFILNEAPYAILIWVLLMRPGRRVFSFLIGLLATSLLEALFNSLPAASYHQIYISRPMGLVWLMLSATIYIVTAVLAYKAIQQTGLQPQLPSVIFTAVATFFYFFLVVEITPYLYRLWG